MKKNLILGGALLLLISCNERGSGNPSTKAKTPEKDIYAGLYEQSGKMFKPLESIALSDENEITEEKVFLGKKLYFDNRLSLDNTQSCNTCHNLNTFGVDNEAFSKGNNGGLGGRNSPTTLNAAFHFVQFWDGREPHVEAQAGGPILNPDEMEMPSEAAVVARLKGISEYVDLFAKAFPKDKNPISYENLKKSLGAFERKLITPSRFDEFLKGNTDALTQAEKKGLQTFIDAGCVTCHSGALLGGDQFQKFGVNVDYWEYTKSKKIDFGRFDATKKEEDKYFFKVPSLRNIEKTYPYFHDGSISDLKEAVRIMAKTQLNKDLSQNEIDEIVTFLNTLTGEVPADLKE